VGTAGAADEVILSHFRESREGNDVTVNAMLCFSKYCEGEQWMTSTAYVYLSDMRQSEKKQNNI
jgi:hypothetical protein